MSYVVNTPVCHIFDNPNRKSEHMDEAFYGQSVDILERRYRFLKIRTFYGYTGWVSEKEITETEYAPTHIVMSNYADLLSLPKNYALPLYNVPRGSLLVEDTTAEPNERYMTVKTVNGGVAYVHRMNVKPIAEISVKKKEIEAGRDAIIETAKTFLGTCYRWGGKTSCGMDCSGLAFMSYYMNGYIVYRDAKFERTPGIKEIGFDALEKGDMLFFPGHVALYIGDGLYIHCTTALGGVGYNSFDENSPIYNEELKNSFERAGRVIY